METVKCEKLEQKKKHVLRMKENEYYQNHTVVYGKKIIINASWKYSVTHFVMVSFSSAWKFLHKQTFFLIFKTSLIIWMYSTSVTAFSLFIFLKGNFPSVTPSLVNPDLRKLISYLSLFKKH